MQLRCRDVLLFDFPARAGVVNIFYKGQTFTSSSTLTAAASQMTYTKEMKIRYRNRLPEDNGIMNSTQCWHGNKDTNLFQLIIIILTKYVFYDTSLRCREPPSTYDPSAKGAFSVQAVNIFNVLPQSIRNMSDVGLPVFKQKFDEFLSTIPDEPLCKGYRHSTSWFQQLDTYGSSIRTVMYLVLYVLTVFPRTTLAISLKLIISK